MKMKICIFKDNRFSVHLAGKRLIFLFAIASTTASPAIAQMDWNGSQSASWFNGLNWTPVGPPGMNDDVVIDTDEPNHADIALADADANALTVGENGSGLLRIRNGRTLTTGATSYIGREAASRGALSVSGANSAWALAPGVLYVGYSGLGILQITNGGNQDGSAIFIANQAGSDGRITIRGANSTLDHTANMYVGIGGVGTLSILDGGQVSTGSFGYIGTSNQGSVTVDGANSTWGISGTLRIGGFAGGGGTGALTISDQGQVTNAEGIVGDSAGAAGTVTVTGAGSVWDNSASLTIGNEGADTLNVEDGAEVSGAIGGWIAREKSSEGTVTVSGTGSTWSSIGAVSVGNGGIGSLTIESGGQVSVGVGAMGLTQLNIGFFSFSEGAVTVSGPGSALTVAHDLLVAAQISTGTMTIENGAIVDVGEAALIGEAGNAQGYVAVTGSGSTWNIGDDLTVGGHHLVATANLTIDPDASVDVGGTVIVATNSGECDCELHVDGNLSSVDGTLINEDGHLTGAGAIGGGATTVAGTVAPGSSAGTLSTRDLVFESTAVLEFELDEPGGTNDSMFANGDLTLDGVLHVSDLGNFGPGSYLLIQYSDTLNDNGLTVGSLPSGFGASVDTTTAGEVRLVVEALPDEVFSDRFETSGP